MPQSRYRSARRPTHHGLDQSLFRQAPQVSPQRPVMKVLPGVLLDVDRDDLIAAPILLPPFLGISPSEDEPRHPCSLPISSSISG